MKNKLPVLIICFFSGCLSATAMPSASAPEGQEQAAMEYFLGEVERDSALAHEERHEKIREFKAFEDQLSPEVSYRLTLLLLEESRARVIEMFQQADLDELEIKNSLHAYYQPGQDDCFFHHSGRLPGGPGDCP